MENLDKKSIDNILADFEFKIEIRDGILQDLIHIVENGWTISSDDVKSLKERWEETK
tara:strand:+ start:309 stop:479 length:171 start_codon:yes stop_codon:yes gene_type:complete